MLVFYKDAASSISTSSQGDESQAIHVSDQSHIHSKRIVRRAQYCTSIELLDS